LKTDAALYSSVLLQPGPKVLFIASVLKDPRPKAWCWWHFWKFEYWHCLICFGSVATGAKSWTKIAKMPPPPYRPRFNGNRGL